jgi:antitoxin PrlF
MLTTITAKGQITLPKDLRSQLDLHSGDKLDFVLVEDGVLQAVPLKQSPRRLKGIVAKPKKAKTIEQMNKAVAKGAAGK